jgi:hypothetical protein
MLQSMLADTIAAITIQAMIVATAKAALVLVPAILLLTPVILQPRVHLRQPL